MSTESAWAKLYGSRNDQAMITATGLNLTAFNDLHHSFKTIYDSHTPFTQDGTIMRKEPSGRGRKRIVDSETCLGLVLMWTRTRGSYVVLQMIFGLTQTAVSVYLRFGRRILNEVLSKDPDAVIVEPSEEVIRSYQEVIANRHPKLNGVWCTMDGLKLTIEQAPHVLVQGSFYNGWTHGHYIGAVIVFCPDGTIPIVCYNAPGSMHDSSIADAGGIYTKLEHVYRSVGGMCTVDSAFAKGNYPFLIKSSQQEDPNDREELLINREATSMRQSAEWGMRSLQASFPRLKNRFQYEEGGERKLMMKIMLLLFNYRARKVGITQIQNVYMPLLNKYDTSVLRSQIIIIIIRFRLTSRSSDCIHKHLLHHSIVLTPSLTFLCTLPITVLSVQFSLHDGVLHEFCE